MSGHHHLSFKVAWWPPIARLLQRTSARRRGGLFKSPGAREPDDPRETDQHLHRYEDGPESAGVRMVHRPVDYPKRWRC